MWDDIRPRRSSRVGRWRASHGNTSASPGVFNSLLILAVPNSLAWAIRGSLAAWPSGAGTAMPELPPPLRPAHRPAPTGGTECGTCHPRRYRPMPPFARTAPHAPLARMSDPHLTPCVWWFARCSSPADTPKYPTGLPGGSGSQARFSGEPWRGGDLLVSVAPARSHIPGTNRGAAADGPAPAKAGHGAGAVRPVMHRKDTKQRGGLHIRGVPASGNGSCVGLRSPGRPSVPSPCASMQSGERRVRSKHWPGSAGTTASAQTHVGAPRG